MYLSDLQNKDIISINTGENLGRIVDVKVSEEGKILNFIAENKGLFRRIKSTELSFTFQDINKIGTDCILVNK